MKRLTRAYRPVISPMLVMAAGMVLMAGPQALAETWNVAENSYKNVRVREVTPATVTIFHSGGITQLSLADLPGPLRERFAYDPVAATEWLEEVEAEREQRAFRRKMRGLDAAPTAPGMEEAVPASPPIVQEKNIRFRKEVDLRPAFREKGLITKNQGRRPSCSIFAVISALEYEQARVTGTAEPLSEEFLIWASRQIQPGIPLDDGYHFNEVITALQTYGVPPHELLPNTYGKKIELIEPSDEAVAAARERTSVTPVWFRRDDPRLIERIVGRLNAGSPVIVGTRWPHWKTLQDNNTLRNQMPLENASHAVTLVGYRNEGGTPEGTTFIFRNSYGYDWGLAGCGFMAASYLQEHVVAALYLRVN